MRLEREQPRIAAGRLLGELPARPQPRLPRPEVRARLGADQRRGVACAQRPRKGLRAPQDAVLVVDQGQRGGGGRQRRQRRQRCQRRQRRRLLLRLAVVGHRDSGAACAFIGPL
ncbi:hypothetical protein MASR1M6_37790 [Rubrivivax sp.]